MWSDSEVEHELREHEEPVGRSSGSGLALTPGALDVASAAVTAPHISQLNVTKKSRMHIGPRFKFVSVTQNVHSNEVVKGRVLGLELEAGVGEGKGGDRSGGRTRAVRLRCSVAVFVCWALAVAVGIALYLLCNYVLAAPAERLDLGIKEPWYLRRADWQAMPAFGTPTLLDLPVQYAIVGHSATEWCAERYKCINEILNIQRQHQRVGWDDIGPNFLVSGDGLVFEGRGANIVGAMVLNWNSRIVSLMFLGDYRRGHNVPSPPQLEHAAALLAALVRAGVLHPHYALLGHCQVATRNWTPGEQLLDELKKFDHWDNVNVSKCLRNRTKAAAT